MIKFYKVLLLGYYPLLLIVAYLQARAILPPYYEPLTGIITVPFSLLVIYLGFAHFKNRKKIPVLGIYFIYTIFTGLFYVYNGRPVILYFQDVAYVLSTMLVAFVAVDKATNKEGKFYKWLFATWVLCFIIGLYLYLVRPDWYTVAITEKHALSAWQNQMLSDEQVLEQFRFGSFTLDSYSVSFISMYLFPLGISYIINSVSPKKWLYSIATIIVVISAILCMQRIVMVCLFVDVIILFFIGNKKIKKSMLLLLLLLSMFLVFGGYSIAADDIGVQVVERFSSEGMDDAVNGSRLTQIKNSLAELDNPVIGQGTGSMGGRARERGLTGVSDCCWVKMVCEHGIVGTLLFIFLIYKTLGRALKNRDKYYVEICAIINILLAMVVSDPMFYQRYILPFWFMIGSVWYEKDISRLSVRKS